MQEQVVEKLKREKRQVILCQEFTNKTVYQFSAKGKKFTVEKLSENLNSLIREALKKKDIDSFANQ